MKITLPKHMVCGLFNLEIYTPSNNTQVHYTQSVEVHLYMWPWSIMKASITMNNKILY